MSTHDWSVIEAELLKEITMSIFHNGQALIVTTRGPGKLHLLSYQNNAQGVNVVGSTQTSSSGVTRFLISFSHHYERFAFHWDGAGEAVYGLGNGLERKPVGRNWQQASFIAWGSASITSSDVTAIARAATNRDNATTCFIIPDLV